MSEKSHVSMEQHVCVVCGKPFDTGVILLDKRMRQTLERNTVTGFGMCAEHEAKRAEGYIALIECDPKKTKVAGDRVANPADAYRTGTVVHVRREVWEKLFTSPVPEKLIAYVDPEVVALLERMTDQEEAS